MKDVETFLAQMNITQYWTRPYTPKYKPFIERFIGTLQSECLDYHYEPLNVKEISEITDAWLDKYHFYRPHEVLGFLTLVQFSATAGVSIQTLADVSYS
jgi:transposase InsO family protein